MTVAQGCIVALSIAALGGVLWLCYFAIKIADDERREGTRSDRRPVHRA